MSPFTQALGNRKPAFPTPGLQEGTRLAVAEVANQGINVVLDSLRRLGFRGLVVKWGDEILLPGHLGHGNQSGIQDADVVRFVSDTAPSATLAAQKEWLAYDSASADLRGELPRQPLEELTATLSSPGLASSIVRVNLGSFAVSTKILDLLSTFLAEKAPQGVVLDWDPFFWFAFFCSSKEGLATALTMAPGRVSEYARRNPGVLELVIDARQRVEEALQRPLRIKVLELGSVYWADLGLQDRLRDHFESLLRRDAIGAATRALYGISDEFDARGNIVLRSEIPSAADVRNSVIIDAYIRDSATFLRSGVVVGGCYGTIIMPAGGVVIESRVLRLLFAGPRAVAFRCAGVDLTLYDGDRASTLVLPSGTHTLLGNEGLLDMEDVGYREAILGNALSYEEAGELLSRSPLPDLLARWEIEARALTPELSDFRDAMA